MSKPIALFDLDGTLADYDGEVRRGLDRLRSPGEASTKTLMACVRQYPPEWLENRIALITKQPGWFRDLPPLPRGFELLAMARSIGFDIHILTKGPRGNRAAWTEKAEWCDIHVPGAPIHVVSNKGMVYGRVLVDDWQPYGWDWLAARPRGLLVMPAQIWNLGYAHPNMVRYLGDDPSRSEVHARLKHAFERKDGES